MMDIREVIVTTEETGHFWTACVWDAKTGTTVRTYKGAGAAGLRSACFLRNDYLLLSDKTKPLLHVWPLNSQQPLQNVKLVCPGKVNALAVSRDALYCVTAIGEKLHVWQLSAGMQLAVAERHYQPVTCVKFTDDGSHFISGGEDGQVLVWPLGRLLSQFTGACVPQQVEPRNSFSHHSLPVRDIYVGLGGIQTRFCTVSFDKTCRLYDFNSGKLLATIIFDVILGAVTMNYIATDVFVGAGNGNIYKFNLTNPPRTLEHHITSKEKQANVFLGHSKFVTCLSLSFDATILLSGSCDKRVILWDVATRQSIRSIEHKGTITNAFLALAPMHLYIEKFTPSVCLTSFHKGTSKEYSFYVRTEQDTWYGDEDYSPSVPAVYDDSGIKDKLLEVTKTNEDLYKFAVEKLFEKFSNTDEKKTNEEENMETADTSVSEDEVKVKMANKVKKAKFSRKSN